MAEIDTPAQAGTVPARGAWYSTRRAKLGILVAALVLVGGVVAGGVQIGTQLRHDAAFDAARESVSSYDDAIKKNLAAEAKLTGVLTESAEYAAAAHALAQGATGVLDAKTLEQVEAAQVKLNGQISSEAELTGGAEPVVEVSPFIIPDIDGVVSKKASVEHLDRIAADIDKATALIESNTSERNEAIARVQTARDDTQAAVLASASSASKASEVMLAAAPSAGAAEKTALASALAELDKAVADDHDVLTAAQTYVTAAKAVTASHAAAEAEKARIAAEEAAKAADAPTYVDPGTGEVRDNPSYSGDSGGGSSGGSSGGNSGGGSSGGGGGGPSVPAGGPSTYDGGYACAGGGGSKSGSGYPGSVSVPSGAIDISSSYYAGGWEVSWACDIGDEW